MSEAQVSEAKSKDGATSEVAEAVVAIVNETVKFVDALGKAIVVVAEDISNLMVIKVDGKTREQLDMLVDVGAAKNRRDAATTLLAEGIRATGETFDKIQQTRAQIKELREQVRAMVKVPAA